MPDLASLRGPLVVTVAYFLLWYCFLFGLQTRTKYRLKARYEKEGKAFDRYFGQDREMLAVDRVVANTHEQMGPFLASLWLFAIFASPRYSTWLGATYIVLRALYAIILGRRVSNTQTKRVAFVTFPSYAIVFIMLIGAVLGAFTQPLIGRIAETGVRLP